MGNIKKKAKKKAAKKIFKEVKKGKFVSEKYAKNNPESTYGSKRKKK